LQREFLQGRQQQVIKTKGQIEAEISQAILKFEKEHIGRGPEEIRTFVVSDMIVVRERGVLTPAEIHLATTPEGKELIKQFRACLVENSRMLLSSMVRGITGREIVALHSDVCTSSGQRVLVFCLDGEVEILPDRGKK
jgi:uncharacterized protein YbcI